ncbi:Uncharacterized protein OS=Lysobacter capsici AZ78 GN=AZ78_04850 PE=4 SV=1 [Gemmataceae bacterium]|nr:Uncharacterized protein OS=Lysobacter capsici AZ78 GN=AZ78_04850 PE=4 SV=1 [Gemmataceae bacterium]VTU02664.1 Uncharacterized protein OS=Lysobacter capsici AZ78 GN=AZ78_04850 PE=4 SV=1 [Gemmataceae bacterium]
MAGELIRVYSDSKGIYWDFGNGQLHVHEWAAVRGLTVSKVDAATPAITVLELIFDWGHADLTDGIPGFADVVAQMSTHLPGLAEEWFQVVEQLPPDGPTVSVWHRDPQSANI